VTAACRGIFLLKLSRINIPSFVCSNRSHTDDVSIIETMGEEKHILQFNYVMKTLHVWLFSTVK
jgi:hypothetical protein